MNFSLCELARELNVLPYTVQKIAHRLNLSVTWTTYDLQRKRMDFSEKQMKYRELCVKYIEWFPNFRRSDLKVYCRAYNWLRNHDSEWLDNLLPAEQPIYINTSDWIQRDEELLEKIQYLIEMIFEEEAKPVRVTISEISKRLDKGQHFSYKTIHKLPRVKSYLSTVTESVEDFQIRKLHWAYNNLVKLSSVISRSRLISTAGIAINPNSKNVIKEIDRILNL